MFVCEYFKIPKKFHVEVQFPFSPFNEEGITDI